MPLHMTDISEHEEPFPEYEELLDNCGTFNLRKASRAVTQMYDDILAPTGFRSTQIVVLIALACKRDVSLATLARTLVVSPSTLSRNLRPLERDGFIEIVSKGKRQKSVQLTEAGELALQEAMPYLSKADEKFTNMVGMDQWQTLNKELARTVSAIRNDT